MRFYLLAAVTIVPATFTLGGQASVGTIDELKDLSLETILVRDGAPEAVIVAPAGRRYERAVAIIRSAVRERTGVDLPVLSDESAPETLLREQHVIALGNMATSRFVERMYRQWYVLLDLRYPGPGGHVVRTLHDPYGFGRNVVWIGGSDDPGVNAAAEVFKGLLGDGDPLLVGRLMEIELGMDPQLPRTVADAEPGGVHTWRDSFREIGKRTTGYTPGTNFGWNPISLAGALYYMTGDEHWLREFKRMALPDSNDVPLANRTSRMIEDPEDPLVRSYHYGAHLLDLVWDLIEESPLFTDEERLAITRKLYEHQVAYDPDDSYSRPNGSRHGVYHMLSIYTGSRYFAKSYPHPRWQKRMENVRRGFRSWIESPTLAEDDTMTFIGSCIEPVLEFFVLDGVEELLVSNAPRTLLGTLESVWTGSVIEESNRYVSLSLLLRAAYLLKDGRYLWLAEQMSFDTERFRVGQSYWPPDELEPKAPLDLVGRFTAAPLARVDHEKSESEVPLERAFQFATYRAGLEPSDDLFLVDGFYGRGRHPYHVGALYKLRLFEGRVLASGHGNQIHVQRQGLSGPRVPRAAALERAVAFDDASYLRTSVPDFQGTTWTRHHFYQSGEPFVVVDELTVLGDGIFDVSCRWELSGYATVENDIESRVRTIQDVLLASSPNVRLRVDGHKVEQRWTGRLSAGGTFVLTNALSSGRRHSDLHVDSVGDRAAAVRHEHASLVALGDLEAGGIELRSEAAYIARDRLLLIGARALRVDARPLIDSEHPIDLSWNLETGALRIAGPDGSSVSIHAGRRAPVVLMPGERSQWEVRPEAGVVRKLGSAILSIEPRHADPRMLEPPWERDVPSWPEAWSATIGSRVAAIATDNGVWAVAHEEGKRGIVVRLTESGEVEATRRYDARPTSLWAASTAAERQEFSALVGFRDDALRAFDRSGQEAWTVHARVHESYQVGDRYIAPWFTDPRPETGFDQRGVNALLVKDVTGTGALEIVLGRPSTVEFRELSGELIHRVPTEWGDNAALALLTDRLSRTPGGLDRALLVGKFRTGSPWLSVIDRERRVTTNHAFSWPAPRVTRMNAWGQRGVAALFVADLDADGGEEVVVALSGHWNELNVYDVNEWREAKWTKSFGPGRPGSRFIRGVSIVPAGDDGSAVVVVGTENAWLHGFGPRGELLFAERLPAPVSALAEVPGASLFVVGTEDGAVHLVGPDGATRALGRARDAVTALHAAGRNLYVGTSAGDLLRFDLP